MKQLIFIGLMLLGTLTYAQSNKPVTVNLTVGGTCDMCKERIERTVDVKGVKYFEYTLATHNLEITYVPSKITEEQLHKSLNAVGHDTNKSKASDDQYDKIHGCCKYRVHLHGEGEHDSDKEEHNHDENDSHDHEY